MRTRAASCLRATSLLLGFRELLSVAQTVLRCKLTTRAVVCGRVRPIRLERRSTTTAAVSTRVRFCNSQRFKELLMDKLHFGSELGQLGGLCLVLPQTEHPVRHYRAGTRSFGLGFTHRILPCKWLQPIPVLPRPQCDLRHYLMRRLGRVCMDFNWCSRPRPELRPTNGRRDVPTVHTAEWRGTLRSMCVLFHALLCPSVQLTD